MNNINRISSLIWSIADDVLRGTFKPNEYGRIILPFVVLRRLDCVLEQNKDLAITTFESYKDKIDEPEDVVLKKLKLSFYNISKFDLDENKVFDKRGDISSTCHREPGAYDYLIDMQLGKES